MNLKPCKCGCIRSLPAVARVADRLPRAARACAQCGAIVEAQSSATLTNVRAQAPLPPAERAVRAAGLGRTPSVQGRYGFAVTRA